MVTAHYRYLHHCVCCGLCAHTQDSRDVELLYRSPGNLLCAAAPLVEEIPEDFLGCDMAPLGVPEKAAHWW